MDAKQADILRRMAEAEGGHRRRLEGRMAELGIPIPDPATVPTLVLAAPPGEDRPGRPAARRPRGSRGRRGRRPVQAPDRGRGHRSAAARDPHRRALALPGRQRDAGEPCWEWRSRPSRRATGPGALGPHPGARDLAPARGKLDLGSDLRSKRWARGGVRDRHRGFGRDRWLELRPHRRPCRSRRLGCRWRRAPSWQSAPRPR